MFVQLSKRRICKICVVKFARQPFNPNFIKGSNVGRLPIARLRVLCLQGIPTAIRNRNVEPKITPMFVYAPLNIGKPGVAIPASKPTH